jgi:hypothetical protein
MIPPERAAILPQNRPAGKERIFDAPHGTMAGVKTPLFQFGLRKMLLGMSCIGLAAACTGACMRSDFLCIRYENVIIPAGAFVAGLFAGAGLGVLVNRFWLCAMPGVFIVSPIVSFLQFRHFTEELQRRAHMMLFENPAVH